MFPSCVDDSVSRVGPVTNGCSDLKNSDWMDYTSGRANRSPCRSRHSTQRIDWFLMFASSIVGLIVEIFVLPKGHSMLFDGSHSDRTLLTD